MPFYFRFRAGPVGFSQRLGQTQAQKRTAAKAAEERRERRHRTAEMWGRVIEAPPGKFAVAESTALSAPRQMTMNADAITAGHAVGDLVKITYRVRDGRLLAVQGHPDHT